MEIMEKTRRCLFTIKLRNEYDRVSSQFRVTPDNIGHAVYPIVEYIHEERPDYIVALDRGARIPALATLMLHRELYGRLPTRDTKIHFRKISVGIEKNIQKDHLREGVGKMLKDTPSPKVLLLDDWIHEGRTKALAIDVFTELSRGKADIHYGVMIGNSIGKGLHKRGSKGPDVWGTVPNFGYYTWHDRHDIMGVEYDDLLHPRRIGSPEAVIFRKRVERSIKNFVEQVRAGNGV